MRLVLGLLLIGALLYAGLVGLVYNRQRALLYPASPYRVTVADAGLGAAFEDVVLATEDGERIVAWYRAPERGKTIVLYFHGNGGSLLNRRERARLLTEGGRGLLIVSYRGYSGSTGTPSEAGLRSDAEAAYKWLAEKFRAPRIVLYGESLGSGGAVPLAVTHPVGGVILDAPFTSAVEVASLAFWFLPVRWLMQDRFSTIDSIGALRAPLLVLHGERDGVVPLALGERLFSAAAAPKRFVRIPGGHHEGNLEDPVGLAAVSSFLADAETRLDSARPEVQPLPSGKPPPPHPGRG